MKKNVERMLLGHELKNMINSRMNSIRQKYGLKKIELDVFLFLTDNPNLNTGRDIQKFLNINKGYLSQVLDALCNEGKIIAETDKNDRRFIHYCPTEVMYPLIEELTAAKEEMDSQLFSGITNEEIAIMERVSEKIDMNIHRILKKQK